MRFYWIKTNAFIKWLFPKYLWSLSRQSDRVFLTFDDGPVPEATPWVLDELQKYNAKATFFCIGENVKENPEIAKRITAEGHSIGNHTYNHLCGWETKNSDYAANVDECEKIIGEITSAKATLFRPPYGKITAAQAKNILQKGYKIVMWDVLSADFDTNVSEVKCLQNVLKNIEPGSIIIFHDSAKAFKNLKYALPRTLEFLKAKGYKCEFIA